MSRRAFMLFFTVPMVFMGVTATVPTPCARGIDPREAAKK